MPLIADVLQAIPWPAAVALALVSFVAYLFISYPDRAILTKARSDVPMAKNGSPIFGHMFAFGKTIPFRHEELLRVCKEMNAESRPFRQTLYDPVLGGMSIITTQNVKDVETILRDPYTFVKGDMFLNKLGDLLGKGIFNSDGARWHAQRKTASHVFNVKNFRDVFSGDFLEEVEQLCNHLEAARKADAVLDLQDLLLRCTLDSFGRLALGSDFGCITQKPIIKDGRYTLPNVAFMTAFDFVQSTVSVRFMKPFWALTERLDGTTAKVRASQKIMYDFADKIIASKRAARKSEKQDASRHSDMLDYFMDTINFDGGVPDDDELRDVCMNLIIAGRDTTAQTLMWVFYCLAQNPEVEAKCRAEAFAVLGKDTPPSYEKLKELKYITATFNETLRLFANVPTNILTATKTTTLAGTGTTIHAGEYVQYSAWVMGHLESIWGPDAAEFRPERWLDDRGNLKKENAFKWPVFKAGPRVCLGMNMATQEGVVFITQILRKFHLELINEDQPEKWGKYDPDPSKREGRYGIAITLSCRVGMDFRVHAL